MKPERQLKKHYEKSVCDCLISALPVSAEFKRYGNDVNEPDCIYTGRKGLLGIEVATVYCKDIHAKQKWTRLRGERQFPAIGYELRWGGSVFNAADIMLKRIQKEINDKCQKTYSGVEWCWLCIYETSDTSDEKTVKNWLRDIRIPQGHAFDAIYLLHEAPTSEGGIPKAFQMWPN